MEKLKRYDLNCNIFSVYDYEGLTINELLCEFFTKINECVDFSNSTLDLCSWLVNEGLSQEVAKMLTKWLNDGTLSNIINSELLGEINRKVNNKYDKEGGVLNGEIRVNINNKELVLGEIDETGDFYIKSTKGSNIYIVPELESGFNGTYRRVNIGGEIRPTETSKYMNGTYTNKWEEVNTRFLRVELNEDDHGSSIADFAQNNVSNSGYIRIFDGSSGKTNTGIAKLLLGFIRKWNKSIINSNGNNLLLSTDLTGSESKKHIEITSENADILPSTTRLQNIGSAEKRFENIYTGGYVQLGRFSSSTRPELSSTNSGAMIFDNTLQKPIWWTGSKWKDANGTEV